MRLYKKEKILLFFLMICIVFSVISAETIIATYQSHDCSHNECHPCIRIDIAKNFLKTLGFAGFALAVIIFFTLYFQDHKHFVKLGTCTLSPILLKVRLNS